MRTSHEHCTHLKARVTATSAQGIELTRDFERHPEMIQTDGGGAEKVLVCPVQAAQTFVGFVMRAGWIETEDENDPFCDLLVHRIDSIAVECTERDIAPESLDVVH